MSIKANSLTIQIFSPSLTSRNKLFKNRTLQCSFLCPETLRHLEEMSWDIYPSRLNASLLSGSCHDWSKHLLLVLSHAANCSVAGCGLSRCRMFMGNTGNFVLPSGMQFLATLWGNIIETMLRLQGLLLRALMKLNKRIRALLTFKVHLFGVMDLPDICKKKKKLSQVHKKASEDRLKRVIKIPSVKTMRKICALAKV